MLRASGVEPDAIRLALFAGHYRSDRPWTDDLLTDARARLAAWRTAVARDAGPDGAGLVAALRAHLADDLDTPGALAAVDAWAVADGSDAGAPGLVRDAVDALLGVAL